MTLTYPGVRLLLMVVGLGFGLINGAQAAGAGRAFPIDSENYVIEKFQRINPNLEWDRTNFLIDLSGQYANCALISRGYVPVHRRTPEDDSIAGYNDYEVGPGSDVNAVNGYLKRVIDRWIDEKVLNNQIAKAKRFGCSVRPGCLRDVHEYEAAVSCLFSPAAADDGYWSPQTSPTHQNSRTSPTHQNSRTSPIHQNSRTSPTHQNSTPARLYALALAFTPEQYKEAELVTNNTWDRSHYLENLSGFETSCAMIGNDDWPFTQAKAYVPNLNFTGIYGCAVNNGTTQGALHKILNNLKKVNSARQVGCSLIPDCMLPNGTMYVVVSCIYKYNT